MDDILKEDIRGSDSSSYCAVEKWQYCAHHTTMAEMLLANHLVVSVTFALL